MKEIRIGLVGFGLSGRVFHEPMIASVEGFKLHKVFERKPANIHYLLQRINSDRITDDIDEIFEDDDIDLIVLGVPNTSHFELAKRALECGKHVLVEKPFTVTSDEAEELIEISKKAGKILTVYHNRRFDSDFKTVKKVIDSGMLGDIVEYEAHFDRFRSEVNENSWRENAQRGSGMLYDLGSHLIDQAQVLFGLPNEVFADLRVQRQGGKAIDYFELILGYDSMKVTLKSGMLVREVGPHFMLHGTRGSFVKYGMDVQEEALRKGMIPKDADQWGVEPETLWGILNTEANGLHVIGRIESECGDYREFYQSLYETLVNGTQLEVSPEQAANTIKIIELAEKSNEEKKWIRFEWK